MVRDCPTVEGSTSTVECHECGGKGHYKDKCPVFLKKNGQWNPKGGKGDKGKGWQGKGYQKGWQNNGKGKGSEGKGGKGMYSMEYDLMNPQWCGGGGGDQYQYSQGQYSQGQQGGDQNWYMRQMGCVSMAPNSINN